MSERKILTLHPQGRKGVNLGKEKYEQIRSTIIECLNVQDLTHMELIECVKNELEGKFVGSINWYTETVKLDLEARFIIERIKEKKPQVYRIKITQ